MTSLTIVLWHMKILQMPEHCFIIGNYKTQMYSQKYNSFTVLIYTDLF